MKVKLTALVLGALVAFSCGEKKETHPKTVSKNLSPKPLTSLEEENKTKLPPNHPPIGHSELMAFHSNKNMTKFDRPIHIPEVVQKTWKFATVDIVDRSTGKTLKEFKVKKGDTINYGDLEIKVMYIVPHLVLDNGYTSGSNEPQNPGILIEVKEKGKVIYAGPIYQKFPTMYNINHPKFIIILKGISKG
jgi:hypothetical protein